MRLPRATVRASVLRWLPAVIGLACVLMPWTAAFAAEPPDIRVLLSEGEPLCTVSGELEWTSPSGALGGTSSQANVAVSGQTVVVRIEGVQRYASKLTAAPRQGHVRFGGRAYRGRLEFFSGRAGGVVVLNVLPLEQYLPGVVPGEMPPSWPPEALRAQAVAARTYAIARMAAQQDATYDVAATVADQVYRGVDGEDDRTSAAVRDTAGLILTYLGVPIVAYFSSDAGGYTRAGGQPYLLPVPASAPESPYRDWSFELSAAELAELAGAAGAQVGTVLGCTASYDQLSGHLLEMTITGRDGTAEFTGPQLRRYVGRDVMRSTRVRIEPLGGGQTTVAAAPARPAGSSASTAALGAFETVMLEAWSRPWVADGAQDRAVKMRSMFAYDGQSLLKCNHTVHIATGARQGSEATGYSAAEQSAVEEVIGGSGGGLAGISVRGSGYGHGVGLSQWGARQLAQEGLTAREILLHFYTGVALDGWNGTLPTLPDQPAHDFYQPYPGPGG